MNPLAWLLGLVLPACAGVGPQGVPVPPPLDLAHLERPTTPNTALAAPEGAGTRPDIATPVFAVPAPRLWAAVESVAAAQPRTYPLRIDQARMESSWVARSAVWNFPDVVTVKVAPTGIGEGTGGDTGSSTLALYSRSLYGRSDFGVNRKRLETWLAALNASLKPER